MVQARCATRVRAWAGNVQVEICKPTGWDRSWRPCASFAGFAFCSFADDILIFAYRKDKVQNVVDSLVDIWQRKGWYCTLRTTPSFIHIADRHLTKALRHTEQKRFDCMLCFCPGQNYEALVCSVRCWKWPCPHGCENGSRRIVP